MLRRESQNRKNRTRHEQDKRDDFGAGAVRYCRIASSRKVPTYGVVDFPNGLEKCI